VSNGWPTKPLGELLSFLTSGSRGWAEYYRESGDLFLRIQNVGRNRMLLDDVAFVAAPNTAEARRTLVQSGDVLLSITADLGRTGVVPDGIGRAFINQHLAILRVQNIHSPFLSAYLASPEGQKQVMGRNKHAVKAGLNFDDIRSFQIPLPPLAEQRRIAEVLDRAEALRAKRRAALAHLDSLTQSLFLAMFGDPATNPKGWPKQKLGDIAKQITDGEHQTPKRTTHGIKLLSARNVRDGFIDVTDVDYVSQEEHDRIKRRCNPEMGDVLISCSGTIGRVATVSTTEPFSLVRSVALIKPKGDIVDSTFLENHLRTPALHSKMQRSANASSQANLFQGQIRELPTTLPPITMQREFARRVTAVEALKTAQRASLAELDALFATLQHRAFRGEL